MNSENISQIPNKKPYLKPAIIHKTKIKTLAGTCVQTVGQSCTLAFA